MTTTSYGGLCATNFPVTTVTAANTFYPIVWDTVYPINANITQNLSTNSLTILVPGVYQVNSIFSFQPNTSIGTSFIDFGLFQNGNPVIGMQARDAGFGANYQNCFSIWPCILCIERCAGYAVVSKHNRICYHYVEWC